MALKKCCCFSVETGTTIIGVLDFLASLGYLIFLSVVLSGLNSNEQDIKNALEKILSEQAKQQEQQQQQLYNTYNPFFNNDNNPNENARTVAEIAVKLVRYVCVIGITDECIMILVTALLFFGIFRRKAICLLPYMIVKALGGIIIILFALITIIAVFATAGSMPVGFTMLVLILALGSACLFVYMWIVVYSHYVVLKEENARGQYDKQPYRAT